MLYSSPENLKIDEIRWNAPTQKLELNVDQASPQRLEIKRVTRDGLGRVKVQPFADVALSGGSVTFKWRVTSYARLLSAELKRPR